MPESAGPAETAADVDWFTVIVREHSTALVRYFARRGPRQDAEDLAAEVFATAWRRRDDLPREAVLPWLYRTAGFTLANSRRKHIDLP
ncbi:RNA polymerase sigma factor, partial [Cryobacterium sp. TMT3-29-2]